MTSRSWPRMSMLVGREVGAALGTVEEVDLDCGELAWGEFMRIRISIDVFKPLLCRKRLNLGLPNPAWVSFSYECFPYFCHCCGRLGHTNKDCIVWLQEKDCFDGEGHPYGAWMKADSHGRLPRTMNTEQAPKVKTRTLMSTRTSRNPKTTLTCVASEVGKNQGSFDETERSNRLFYVKGKLGLQQS